MTDADHDLSPLHAPADSSPADRILVQGLEFDTIIGILPAERETPQPLRVDVVLEVHSFHEAVESEQIERTVDYAAVARRITEIAREGRFQLVETLAETTCARLLAEFPVRRVTLRAIKPHALADAAGVGVEITRQAGAVEDA
ncbi:dihydroneopterin aldolase [Guyparkeria sp. 1SP6A2]|nr:dihydroneopterin aldolase [Guyparkeria sp. 1SP6A2]